MYRSVNFDPRLESLRGMAAVAVVITHSTAIFRIDGQGAFWALHLHEYTAKTFLLELVTAIFNAGSAVILFFVLSGYVLTLSLQRSKTGLAAYAIRRGFRLLPPMWASIAVMMIVVDVIPLPASNSYSEAFTSFRHITAESAFSNAIFQSFSANPVTWTMYVEVIGSAFLPLVLWMWDRFGLLSRYGMLAALAVMTVFLWPPSWTFSYLICFYVGAMLATHEQRPTLVARERVALGLFLFFIDRFAFGNTGTSILVNTLGAVLVITGITSGAAKKLLLHPIARHIGRVSYSLYLLQFVPILLTGIALGNIFRDPELIATMLAILIILPASIALATVAYSAFEAPSIRASRAIIEFGSRRASSVR